MTPPTPEPEHDWWTEAHKASKLKKADENFIDTMCIPRAKVQELKDKNQRMIDNINEALQDSEGRNHTDDYTMGNIAGYIQACELLLSEGKEKGK